MGMLQTRHVRMSSRRRCRTAQVGLVAFALLIASPSGLANAATIPLPPFGQCPAVGVSTSCKVLLVVEADGSITVYDDAAAGTYDGADDTLVGIVNSSGTAVPAVSVTGVGSGLGSLDGDGLCAFITCTWSAPTGYEGPGTALVTDPDLPDSAEVDFTGGLAPGASTYFSLEGTLTSAALTARQGHLTGPGYVAMGDSFSSGESNLPFIAPTANGTDACHRSHAAYPELLVDNPAARLTRSPTTYAFVACSGATRRSVWLGSPANAEPSQLAALSVSTGLVTLSVGGNDIEFPNVLDRCVTGSVHAGGSADCQHMQLPGPNGRKESLDARETRLINDLGNDSDTLCQTPNGFTSCVPSLSHLYGGIALASQLHVRVRVLLYPHLFTTAPSGSCTLLSSNVQVGPGQYVRLTAFISQKNMTWINAGIDRVDNKIIEQVNLARQAGLDVVQVDPRPAFDNGGTASPGGHGACTRQPWIRGLSLRFFNDGSLKPIGADPTPYSFHPNATGQQQFQQAVLAGLN
jgi:hypothetical protein